MSTKGKLNPYATEANNGHATESAIYGANPHNSPYLDPEMFLGKEIDKDDSYTPLLCLLGFNSEKFRSQLTL